jgi:hypothetical protein
MYTVTKANQNEALLWKIAVLGMEKSPCWCRNNLSFAHAGILHSSLPKEISGREENKIPKWTRDKMFPFPSHDR